MSDQIYVTLISSKEDGLLESEEYQAAIKECSSQLPNQLIVQRTSYAMDSTSGGGGLLGEFILKVAPTLAQALSLVIVTWINKCPGRRVKIKNGLKEIEVDHPEDLEVALRAIKILQSESQIKDEEHI